jgi:GT2 family glycosyltransferase
VLLNNDTEVLAGWLEPLLEAFGNPQVAVAGSLLLYPGAEIIQHAGIELWRERGVLKPFHIGQFQRLRLTPWAVLNREVPAVTGACLAMRRNALPQGTFLDETFRNGFEDIDLCFRLRTAGWTVRYCGASHVIHHESLSAARFAKEQENLRIFQKRWGKMRDSLPASQSRMAVHPLRARRRYLQDPSPANAAKVAGLLERHGMSMELPMWGALAKGRFFAHRRVSMELRQALERELGLDQLKIRDWQNLG